MGFSKLILFNCYRKQSIRLLLSKNSGGILYEKYVNSTKLWRILILSQKEISLLRMTSHRESSRFMLLIYWQKFALFIPFSSPSNTHEIFLAVRLSFSDFNSSKKCKFFNDYANYFLTVLKTSSFCLLLISNRNCYDLAVLSHFCSLLYYS